MDKYVLKHQEQDSGGEVRTELYKGDILFTRTGGASVKFTDIEKLNHLSPQFTRRVTRSMTRNQDSFSSTSSDGGEASPPTHKIEREEEEEEWTDVETRVS